jgi:hypothetical protein
MPRDIEEDGKLTGDQRLREIARILAGALLRRCRRGSLTPAAQLPDSQIPPQSRSNCLEFSGHTRLTVHVS